MKKIQLTKGYEALVDDEDFEYLSQFKWYPTVNGCGKLYVSSHSKTNRAKVYMHRMILKPPDGLFVDHVDGNTFNNQRSNLRICSRRENGRNRGKQKDNTSGYKGVSWDTWGWKAYINTGGRNKNLGRFKDKDDAARAYNKAALEYHGEYAYQNILPHSPGLTPLDEG